MYLSREGARPSLRKEKKFTDWRMAVGRRGLSEEKGSGVEWECTPRRMVGTRQQVVRGLGERIANGLVDLSN